MIPLMHRGQIAACCISQEAVTQVSIVSSFDLCVQLLLAEIEPKKWNLWIKYYVPNNAS